MTRCTQLKLMIALGSFLTGSGCDKDTTRLLVDATLASCSESQVFLSSWWSGTNVTPEIDPIGGSLLIYWIDEDGNACHGTPGTSGKPGPVELTAHDTNAMSASRDGLSVTTTQLEDFQETPFDVLPYAASGLHFVQHYNNLWRIRADGIAFRSTGQFSQPAVVSMDIGSFCVIPVVAMEQECRSTMALFLPSLSIGTEPEQHPTKCKTRSKPTEISPTIEVRQDSCLLRLPHGMEISPP